MNDRDYAQYVNYLRDFAKISRHGQDSKFDDCVREITLERDSLKDKIKLLKWQQAGGNERADFWENRFRMLAGLLYGNLIEKAKDMAVQYRNYKWEDNR